MMDVDNLPPSPPSAEPPPIAHLPVVSPRTVVQWQGDRPLVLADCRFALADPHWGRQQYTTEHLPNAQYFDLNQDLSGPVEQHGGRHPLPNVETLVARLEAAGISNDTWVVAYDDARLAFAARFWWLLRYLGHPRVAVLDGGIAGWQAAGYPLTQGAVTPVPGHFVPRVQADRVVDIDQVRSLQQQQGSVLVDAREAPRYRGEQEPIDPIAGHIPGAVNYPWQAVTDEQGQIRAIADQQQHWKALGTADPIVVYCGSGVTACVNLLSMEMAGIHHAKLYPGSWSDWCSYPMPHS